MSKNAVSKNRDTENRDKENPDTRINSIQNAAEIFFVNAAEVIRAGSFDLAVKMLLHGERASLEEVLFLISIRGCQQ